MGINMSGAVYRNFESIFARSIREYLKEFGEGKKYFQLSAAEIAQLRTYQPVIDTESPEVRNDVTSAIQLQLHFEVKRSLTRLFGLLCLLNDNYDGFTAGQPEASKLSHESFSRLRNMLAALSADEVHAIRTTCFLSISENAKDTFREKGLQPNSDSEAFLSQLAENLAQHPDLMPATCVLSSNQRSILSKAYWPETHFRHLLFLEGGSNMVSDLVKGIKSQSFSQQDFQIWKWRWLTNLFGFKVGVSAQNYDAVIDTLSFILISELDALFTNPNKDFMNSYLGRLQKLFSLETHADLTDAEKMYIAKIAMSMHDIKDIATSAGATLLVTVYKQYKQDNAAEAARLIDLFARFMETPDIKTPTYMPAVLNGAIKLFKEDVEVGALLPAGLTPIQAAVMFQFAYSPTVYEKALSLEKPRISGRLFAAQPALKSALLGWLGNGMKAQFGVSDKLELETIVGCTLSSSNSIKR